MFEKPQGEQRHCQDLSHEVNIKPVVQYQGGHLLGFSTENYSQEPAKTALALIVAPLMGKPAFLLKAKFLFEQVGYLLKLFTSSQMVLILW